MNTNLVEDVVLSSFVEFFSVVSSEKKKMFQLIEGSAPKQKLDKSFLLSFVEFRSAVSGKN